jgi:hypothetical protein
VFSILCFVLNIKGIDVHQINRQLRWVILLFAIPALIMTGCAAKQTKIPKAEILERADRAFDDLSAEETRESKRESTTKPSSHDKNKKDFQSTKGKKPDWVDGESIRYPSTSYLSGVGYGPDRQSSEDKARAEIAKIFYSDINSRSQTYQEYLQTISGKKSETAEKLSIEEITEVSTKKVLSGVRIVQVHEATTPKPIYYALAVLDRNQSAEVLRYKIKETDQDIKNLLSNAKHEEDKLSKIKGLKTCIRKYILREAYDAELRIVSPSGKGVTPPINFIKIKNMLNDILLRDFLIALSVKGSKAKEIQEALVVALNQKGFSVSEDFDKVSVIVRGDVEIKPIDRGTSEWKYVRWNIHIDLIDKRGGAVFGSVNKTGREGHLSLPQAENKAVRKIRKTVTTDIAEELKQYIFSQ